MKNQMNKQKGFTLIELIIVIVILGILAVTAAPRFIDLQEDARASTLEGVKAALQGGAQLVYAKSAIAGVQREPADNVTLINTDDVATVYGYPSAGVADDFIAGSAGPIIASLYVDLSADDFTVLSTGGTFTISLDGGGTTGNCHVLYTDAVLNQAPTIVVDSSGC
jgi:MSHA pilin protein MshA